MRTLTLKIITYFISFLIFINIIFLSSLFVLNFKQLYYFDINYLDIKNSSGYSEEKIKENYNYTINYVNKSSLDEYSPPSLKASKDGKNHFKDVQNIFKNIKFIISLSIIMIPLGIFILERYKYQRKYLKISSILLTIFPFLLIILFSLDFNWIFTLFHKAVFSSNNWLFDPEYDQIINILPEDYFMHCASLILLISIISGLILMIIFRRKKDEVKSFH